MASVLNNVSRHDSDGKYQLNKWSRLNRFLILGVDRNFYSASQSTRVFENVTVVNECIAESPSKVVAAVRHVLREGLAKNRDACLWTLAQVNTQEAFDAAATYITMSTDLFHFIGFVRQRRGMGKMVHRFIQEWYNSKSDAQLAYQFIKYRQRDGWSHRDVLRLGRPKHREIYRYVTQNQVDTDGIDPDAFNQLVCFNMVMQHQNYNLETSKLVVSGKLPWEALPTNMHNFPEMWEDLMSNNLLPMGAMLRQLRRFVGFHKAGAPGPLQMATTRLTNETLVRKARLHPMNILNAAMVLHNEENMQVNELIMKALDKAFEASMQDYVPTGKRILVGLDISPSMASTPFRGAHFTSSQACAAMLTTFARTEPYLFIVGFAHQIMPLNFNQHDHFLNNAKDATSSQWGWTNCAAPFAYALGRGLGIEAFVVMTDNDTNHVGRSSFGRRGYVGIGTLTDYNIGDLSPADALKEYRQRTGIDAKLVVMATDPAPYTIADPNDKGMLDIAGYSPDVFKVATEFISGAI